MAAKIIRLHRPKDAEAIIRALALDSANVQITLHAFERMEERGFTTTDLFRVLTTGMVTGTPIENEHGDFTCKVVKRLKGSRDAGVITIIVAQKTLIIKTMEWEDLK